MFTIRSVHRSINFLSSYSSRISLYVMHVLAFWQVTLINGYDDDDDLDLMTARWMSELIIKTFEVEWYSKTYISHFTSHFITRCILFQNTFFNFVVVCFNLLRHQPAAYWQYDYWGKCINRIKCISISNILPVVIITVLSTVLSCVAVVCLSYYLLYVYMPLSQRSVCDCNKRILYCIV